MKNIILTAAIPTKNGYIVKGKITYVKAVNAPASMVKTTFTVTDT